MVYALLVVGEVTQPIPLGAMARVLRVKVAWLRQEAEAGRIPALRAGDTFLFDPFLIQRLLLERARTGGEGGSCIQC